MSINYKKLNKDFESKGFFVIRRLIDNKKILSLQKILSELFLLELNKKKFNIRTFKNKKKLWENPKFCKLLNIFRKNYPEDFSKIYNDIKNNPQLLDILNDKKIIKLTQKILKINLRNIWNGEFMLRIDVPNDIRNTIGWHQEANYYKKQTSDGKNGIVYWIALSENIKKINGAIEVKRNSHKIGLVKSQKKQVKKINISDKFKSVTFEPEKNILQKFKTEVTEVKMGDLIAMDLRLFHRSGKNKSKIIRLSCINRVFDTSKINKDIR